MGPQISNIVILDVLPKDHLQTGIGLLQHLQDHLSAQEFRLVAYKKIRTEADIECYLLHIRSMARVGCKPVIHIECHGHKERGIKLENGYFKWSRLLEHLRKINSLADNNLVLFLSSCYGGSVINALDITKPCPFLLLASSDEEVQAGFIQDTVGRFYVQLVQSADFRSAAKVLAPKFCVKHAELVFIAAFASYMKDHANAKARQRRLDELVTRLAPDATNRALARKQMRLALGNHRAAFESLGRQFLHGRQHFSYEEFERAYITNSA